MEQGRSRSLLLGSNRGHEMGERHRLVGLDNWGVVAEFCSTYRS